MSAIRQSNLFAGEHWTATYTAFTAVDFTAYDFDTIKTAMVSYIRKSYPEDFNDWIQSSEFVAIIDLLAYMGQSLAYRIDLNSRENFLDTAERRESILKLARMLSYNPKRNGTASGMVKITSVTTSETVIDSNGRDLANIPIIWNDPVNRDWFEQFILVLNAVLEKNTNFGTPHKNGFIDGIKTELYNLDNIRNVKVVSPFTANISGSSVNFEIVNADFTDMQNFFEDTPSPTAPQRILYRNDGNGNNSADTGFFMMFKQGTLSFVDYQFDVLEENRIVDIDVQNINETDVWVQSIATDGTVNKTWTKVPTIDSNNIVFNNVSNETRDIYTVLTRENDQISVKFSDGRFGSIPTGIIRIWYRVSNGLTYEIKKKDIREQTLPVNYRDAIGQEQTLSLTFSLQTKVNNSSNSETNDDIKRKATQVYAAQNRMVTGEDYNTFPLSRSNNALKIQAINRTYSGHNRYIGLNDPTGSTQNIEILSEDGIIYSEKVNQFEELSTDTAAQFILDNKIKPIIKSDDYLHNFYYNYFSKLLTTDQRFTFSDNLDDMVVWRTVTSSTSTSTGMFYRNNEPLAIGAEYYKENLPGADDANLHLIDTGCLVRLVDTENVQSEGIWVTIESLTGFGNEQLSNGFGPVVLNHRIKGNAYFIKEIVPALVTEPSTSVQTDILAQINAKNNFGIGFDMDFAVNGSPWYIITGDNLSSSQAEYSKTRSFANINTDSSWLVHVELIDTNWAITFRGRRYVFESEKNVEFYFSNTDRTFDSDTGLLVRDEINVLKINELNGKPLESDYKWSISKSFVYDDGYVDPKRIEVVPVDSDDDGVPDNPYQFSEIVEDASEIFYKTIIDNNGYENTEVFEPNFKLNTVNELILIPKSDLSNGDIIYVRSEADEVAFREYVASVDNGVNNRVYDEVFKNVSSKYKKITDVRKNLKFIWRHYASKDVRVDPSVSNIIDLFVLDRSYHTSVSQWLNNIVKTKPRIPTPMELKNSYKEVEEYKMLSDQIIWRPVKYKVIFGDKADKNLQASVKVIKTASTQLTSNEIRIKIVDIIKEYFAIENWEFGENFYASEMIGYIHNKMATHINSVVVVPATASSKFGELFEVFTSADEILTTSVGINDIEIVDNFTPTNIKIGV